MIDAVQVTHVLDNRKSESEANMWIDSSIATERQHKISEVKEEGSEHGGEVGITAKGEVSWKAGVPGWASGGSKAGLEASGKYVGKKVEKKIVGEENTNIIKVSHCKWVPWYLMLIPPIGDCSLPCQPSSSRRWHGPMHDHSSPEPSQPSLPSHGKFNALRPLPSQNTR
jgi:hypothetical protein